MYLAISHCYPVFLCTVISLLFATSNSMVFSAICYAFLTKSHGHTFVLTNYVSWLNEHNTSPSPCSFSDHPFRPTNAPQAASTSRVGNELTCSPHFAGMAWVWVTQFGTHNVVPVLWSGIPDVGIADCKSERQAGRFHPMAICLALPLFKGSNLSSSVLTNA
jgi:hypothetical protein